MNRQRLITIVLNIVFIVLPLVFKPQLMLHYKIILLITGSIFMWLTQPVFTIKETQDTKSSDRFSVVVILLMSLVSFIFPVSIWAYGSMDKSLFNGVTVAGILLMAGGIALRAWSVSELGIYFRPTVQIQKKHKLVTTGPYKLIRHPSYAGAFLAITSSALILNTITGYLIAIVAMTFCYAIRIRIEEQELVSYFGELYRTYTRRTKKMIPFVL